MSLITAPTFRTLAAATTVAAASLPAAARGSIEEYISFQARLTDQSGDLVGDGEHTLDFFIYDAETGGTLIGSVVNVPTFVTGGKGVVSTSFPVVPAWFAEAPRYLGITIDDDDDIPAGDEIGRIRLTAVPSALMAWGIAPGTPLNVTEVSVKDTLAVTNAIGVGIEAFPEIPLYARQVGGTSPIVAAFEAATGVNNINFAGIGASGTDGWSTRFNFFDAGVNTNSMSVLKSGKVIFSGSGQPFGNVSITAEGKIGIGTEYPYGKLHVYQVSPGPGGAAPSATFETLQGINSVNLYTSGLPGNPSSNRISFFDSGQFQTGILSTHDGRMILGPALGGDDYVTIGKSGFVGVGTSTPSYPLDVRGTMPDCRIQVRNDAEGGHSYHLISAAQGSSAPPGSLRIYDSSAADGTGIKDRLVVSANGNVGVGVLSPQSRLDVNGTTRTKVIEITGGADIAEPFRIRCPEGVHSVLPGMVVVIDSEHAGDLRVAESPLDRRVAGIVSGANGIGAGLILRSEGDIAADGPHPVAMAGRVWCLCDASYGAVAPGDRLTTSATPGHGMRVADGVQAEGAVIGKAMTSLAAGRGLVLVLVDSQ